MTTTAPKALSPKEFADLMNQRLAAKDYSCEGLTRVGKESCYAWQAATALNEDKDPSHFQLFYAMSAINRVAARVSISRYILSDYQNTGIDPEKILAAEAGLCGNRAFVLEAMLQQIGLTTRQVHFYYNNFEGTPYSHAANEVNIGGKWRYFDSTWIMFYLTDTHDPFSVASVEEILAGKTAAQITNRTMPWLYWAKMPGNSPDEHFKPGTGVIYGLDSGSVPLDPLEGGEIKLVSRPNTVGDSVDDGPFEGVRFTFPPLKGTYDFTIEPSAIGGCNHPDTRFCVGSSCVVVPPEREIFTLRAKDADGISIHAPGEPTCYVTFKKISFAPAT